MNIVVLDRFAMGLDTPVERLERFGHLEIYDTTDPSELIERAKSADILVLNKVKIGKFEFDNLPKLKLICIFATGYDNIDITSAREHNVAVCNVPGYSTDSVALFTVANVLALYSRLYEYNSFVRSGEYSCSGVANKLTPVYHELRGKVWGIVGLGNIGRAVAKVAEAFGAKVIAYKRNPVSDYECVDIDELCSRSDIITLHCPLNDGTRNLITKARIALMKKEVIIVNEARGAVINENDICEAILNDEIGAFGSDVYSVEPFAVDHPFYRIKDKNNVLLTPHAAWGAYEARARCLEIICDNIDAYINYEIKNRVDI